MFCTFLVAASDHLQVAEANRSCDGVCSTSEARRHQATRYRFPESSDEEEKSPAPPGGPVVVPSRPARMSDNDVRVARRFTSTGTEGETREKFETVVTLPYRADQSGGEGLAKEESASQHDDTVILSDAATQDEIPVVIRTRPKDPKREG